MRTKQIYSDNAGKCNKCGKLIFEIIGLVTYTKDNVYCRCKVKENEV